MKEDISKDTKYFGLRMITAISLLSVGITNEQTLDYTKV